MTNQGITDLGIIRNSLKNCEEVTLPYKFTKNCRIKYITIKGEDEAFYEGGLFLKMGNQKVILKNGKSTLRIPTYIKSDDGEIIYRSRFFIDTQFTSECEINKNKLEKTVQAQQIVIEKMSKQIKILEESKQKMLSDHYEMTSLLQDKEDEIKELHIKEKKYKLLLTQYIH